MVLWLGIENHYYSRKIQDCVDRFFDSQVMRKIRATKNKQATLYLFACFLELSSKNEFVKYQINLYQIQHKNVDRYGSSQQI